MKSAPFIVMNASGASHASASLDGPPRVMHFPAARTHGYGDRTGPRRIIGCTNFCAGRDWHDGGASLAAAKKDIQTARSAGYQYKRVMRVIGFDGDGTVDGGYFAGRGVSPLWYKEWLADYCYELLQNGLGLQLTCGHNGWSYAERLEWEESWMFDLKNRGVEKAVYFLEGDNEGWQNAPGRDSDEQIAWYAKFKDLAHRYMPHVLVSCGAPEDESPENIARWCGAVLTPAEIAEVKAPGGDIGKYFDRMCMDISEIHTKRDEDLMLKRELGIWYWEGKPGYFPLPYLLGEPTPAAGGQGDFMGTAFPGRQVAQAGLGHLFGAGYTYFDGWDVSSPEPLDADAPTFWTIPAFLREAFPENVAESTILPDPPGHRLTVLWWTLPDGRLATVADETWNAFVSQPDIRKWTAYGPGNAVIKGDGAVKVGSGPGHIPPGYGGALIVAEAA